VAVIFYVLTAKVLGTWVPDECAFKPKPSIKTFKNYEKYADSESIKHGFTVAFA